MTNESNSSRRLDRIENALERLIGGLEETKANIDRLNLGLEGTKANIDRLNLGLEGTKANIDRLNLGLEGTKAIANSNSRAIQAMMEQEATDRLRHEERMERHDQEIAELKEITSRLTEVQIGIARMLGNIDETNPTILRRLMNIEDKVDLF